MLTFEISPTVVRFSSPLEARKQASVMESLALAAGGSPTLTSWSSELRMHLKGSGSSSIGAEPKARRRKDRLRRHARCSSAVTSDPFSSPKTGTLGEDRFKDGAVPGTYWNDSLDLGEKTSVCFNTGSNTVTVECRAGENLLRLAERCGVTVPNAEFCFEGSCCRCEMEIQGGAVEVGYRADTSGADLIRSCICPVPGGREIVEVNVLSEEDVWGEGVL